MPSFETLPGNVVQTIAFFSVTSATLGPPRGLIQMFLISRAVWNALRPDANPIFFADLFKFYFDLDAPRRKIRSSGLNAFCLSAEMIQRFQVLKRIRDQNYSDEDEDQIRNNLWTAYMMLLESDGLNERHLKMAGISSYACGLIRHRFGAEYESYGLPLNNEINSLALWLTCLTATSDTIFDKSNAFLERVYGLLRPLVMNFAKFQNTPRSPGSGDTSENVTHPPLRECKVICYSHELTLSCPSLSSAAILLSFLVRDVLYIPQVPPHVPRTRAIANSKGRTGATMDDYIAASEYRTPTVADALGLFPPLVEGDDIELPRSMMHNDDFNRVTLYSPSPDIFSKGHAYAPGILTGLWEGYYMVCPSQVAEISYPTRTVKNYPDFTCRQPMQCRLREHLKSYPEGMLPDANLASTPAKRSYITSRSDIMLGYLGSPCSSEPSSRLGSCTRQSEQSCLEANLTGETQQDHGEAWGAFKYTGTVRFGDGLIVLKRQPKNTEEHYHGVWIFEGYMHSRRVIVGRWYSTQDNAEDARLEGIFCLSKQPSAHVRDTGWPSRL